MKWFNSHVKRHKNELEVTKRRRYMPKIYTLKVVIISCVKWSVIRRTVGSRIATAHSVKLGSLLL